jgi:hypothetical protein
MGHHEAVLIDLVKVAVGPPETRVLWILEGLDEFFEVRRIPDVILIKERDQRASRMPDREVTGR